MAKRPSSQPGSPSSPRNSFYIFSAMIPHHGKRVKQESPFSMAREKEDLGMHLCFYRMAYVTCTLTMTSSGKEETRSLGSSGEVPCGPGRKRTGSG